MTNKTKIIIGSAVGGVVLLGGIGSLSNNTSDTSSLSNSESSYISTYKSSGQPSTSTTVKSVSEPSQASTSKQNTSTISSIGSITPNISKPSENLPSMSSSNLTASQTPQVASVSVISSKPEQTTIYVLNTNTRKVHTDKCHYIDEIEPQNYATTTDLQDAKNKGYTACGRCKPF